MRWIGRLVALVAASVLVLGVGTASAHNKTLPSTVVATGFALGPGPNHAVYGFITGNKRCTANRPVRLIFRYPGGASRVVDRGRTSQNGNYGLSGDPNNPPGGDLWIVRAPRHRVGPISKRHRHICQASQQEVD
ncbi:MAG TPA: hypothetical protein VK919_06705 [Solirubrobacterales bacterium]|nr:hypothetical protein [Solirubrobacterales bacterium]